MADDAPLAVDDIAEINRLAGRACLALLADAPHLIARLERDAAIVLSGEPTRTLNPVHIGPSSRSEELLVEATTIAKQRGLPIAVFLTPHVAENLESSLLRLGLAYARRTPMMLFKPTSPVEVRQSYRVMRAHNVDDIRIAGDLVAAAFEMPRKSVANALDSPPMGIGGIEIFLAEREGVAMSAVSVVRVGDTAGIWCMATPPEHQRKGAAHALLAQVLETYRTAGVTRFYLTASTAGRPLYERIGFKTIADYAVWTLG